MVHILLVKSNGSIVEKNVKTLDETQLYKVCNYKNNTGFELLCTYCVSDAKYKVYGKKDGKANHENKYDFPPPIDSALFFGTLCILKKEDGSHESLCCKEWEKVYESLFGGFEDIGNESEERSEDSEIYDDEDYTTEGYLKDGFVVEDDDELEEEEYIDE